MVICYRVIRGRVTRCALLLAVAVLFIFILALPANADDAGITGSFTVSGAPVVSISLPASGSVTNNPTVTVCGTVVADPALSEAALVVNGVSTTISVVDTAFSQSVTLIEGSNTITVTATDGTDTRSCSVTVTLDTVLPVVTITCPPNNYITGDQTLTITGTIDDTSITQATLTLNGDDDTITISAGAFSQSVTLEEGINTISVSATDSAGNTGTSGSFVVTYDATRPAVSITSPINGYVTGSASLTISGTVVDSPAITEATLRLNGSDSTITVTDNNFSQGVTLSPGVNTVEVTASDSSGNAGSSGIITVTLDKTAPVVTITSPTDGLQLGTTSITITGTVDDPSVTQVTLTLNGADSTITVTDGAFSAAETLQEGSNTILVTASDAYNNEGTSSTVTVEVDTDKATVTITTPSTGLVTNAASLPVSGTVDDPAITEATLRLNGASQTLTVSGGEFGAIVTLSEGVNTIAVAATDELGNTGSSGVITATLDITAPTISLTSPTPGLFVNTASLTVSGTIDDPSVTTATLTLNGADEILPVQARSFSRTVVLKHGDNTISVSATDTAGNTGTTGTIAVTLDTDAPAVTVTSPASGSTTNTSTVGVSGTVVDDPAIVEATLTLNGNSSTITVTDGAFSHSVTLVAGANTILVSATDGVNTGNSGTVTVTLDTTAPVLTINLSHPADTILITVSSNEALQAPPTVSVNPAVDMTLVDTNEWTGTYNIPADGSYTVSISGTDEAGNTASETATFAKETVTITEDETEEVTIANTKLEIQTTETVTDASISVSQHMKNPAENAQSETEAGIFLEIVASAELRDNLESISIQVDYVEADITARGIDESTLKLYLWDVTTGQWQVVPGSGVNTAQNCIYGTITHLSKYGGFGTAPTPPSPPTPRPPGGGGGGGKPQPPERHPPPGTTDVSDFVDDHGVFSYSVTAESADGMCQLSISEGTTGLSEEGEPLNEISIVQMQVSPPPPEGANIIGLIYDFGPDGATFVPPIMLTITYDPSLIPEGVREENLGIAYYDEDTNQWTELECLVDTEANIISAKVSHFTALAVLGYPVIPAALTVTDLSISPGEVYLGQTVSIGVIVINTGGESGIYKVTLKINSVLEATKKVTVNAGSNKEVTFAITKHIAGTYLVDVDGVTGSFTVTEKVLPPVVPIVPLIGVIIGVIAVGLLVYSLASGRRRKQKSSRFKSEGNLETTDFKRPTHK